MPNENDILKALKEVNYPGYSRDIVSFGIIKEVTVANGAVSILVQLTSNNPEVAQQIKSECQKVLKAVDGIRVAHVKINQPEGSAPSQTEGPEKMPGIGKVVAVASGKGGVGKSTVSANLSCGLVHLGARVGLLDCDIYGPSIPLMMGVNERPAVTEDDEKLIPLENHGIKLMSMGFLLQDDQPVIWRGPMIMRTIQQFISQVLWGLSLIHI